MWIYLLFNHTVWLPLLWMVALSCKTTRLGWQPWHECILTQYLCVSWRWVIMLALKKNCLKHAKIRGWWAPVWAHFLCIIWAWFRAFFSLLGLGLPPLYSFSCSRFAAQTNTDTYNYTILHAFFHCAIHFKKEEQINITKQSFKSTWI
jgi:hypothetical protein